MISNVLATLVLTDLMCYDKKSHFLLFLNMPKPRHISFKGYLWSCVLWALSFTNVDMPINCQIIIVLVKQQVNFWLVIYQGEALKMEGVLQLTAAHVNTTRSTIKQCNCNISVEKELLQNFIHFITSYWIFCVSSMQKLKWSVIPNMCHINLAAISV